MGNQQELKIKIIGDASGASAVLVGTTDQIRLMKDQLDQTGTAAVKMGEEMNTGMNRGTGAVRLLTHELGIPLPRELSRLIGTIPGVSAALTGMLPIIGVVAMISVIGKLISHHEALAAAMRKTAAENEDLSIKENDFTKSMELANLKLDDQISKLEGHTTTNRLKEELLETSIAVDKLGEHFAADFQKVDEAVVESTSFLSTFKQNLLASTTSLFDPKGMQDTLASLNAVDDAWARLNSAKMNYSMAAPGSDIQRAALKEEIASYTKLRETQETALAFVKENMPGNTAAVASLTKGITLATYAIKDFGLESESAAKRAQAGMLGDADAAAKVARAFATEQISDAARVAEAWLGVAESQAKETATTLANLDAREDQAKTFADQKYDIERARIESELALHKSASDEDKTAREKLNSDLEVVEAKHQTAINEIVAKYSKERTELEKKAAEDIQRVANDNLKHIEEEQKQALKFASERAHGEEELASAVEKSKEADVKDAESRGLITKKSALEQSLGFIQEELTAKLRAIDEKTAADQAALQIEIEGERQKAGAAALGAGQGDVSKQIAFADALERIAQLTAQITQLQATGAVQEQAATTQTNTALAQTQNQLDALSHSWSDYFQKMDTETKNLGDTIRGTLQDDIAKMQKAFGDAIGRMIITGQGFGKTMFKVEEQIAEQFISMCVQMLEKWLMVHAIMPAIGAVAAALNLHIHLASQAAMSAAQVQELGQFTTLQTAKTAAITAALTAQTAAYTAAQAAQLAVEKLTASQEALSLVGLAGAGGVASMAAAPFPVDLSAPAFVAAMAAAAAGFAVPVSAEEGGISVGGLTLLHPNEMVLPAPISQKVQDMAEGAGGGSGGEMHTHFHISAIDAGGVQSFFKKHGSAMADAWHAQVRQGSINLAQAYRGK